MMTPAIAALPMPPPRPPLFLVLGVPVTLSGLAVVVLLLPVFGLGAGVLAGGNGRLADVAGFCGSAVRVLKVVFCVVDEATARLVETAAGVVGAVDVVVMRATNSSRVMNAFICLAASPQTCWAPL